MEMAGGEGGRRGQAGRESPVWETQLHQNQLIQLLSTPLAPPKHNPLLFLGNQPTDCLPLNWAEKADGHGRHRQKGAGLKPTVQGTKMTQKGKYSDSDSRRQGTSETETNGDGLRQISKSLLLPRSIFTWQPSSSPFPGTPHPSPARTSHWAPLLGPPPMLFLQSGKMGREARKWDHQVSPVPTHPRDLSLGPAGIQGGVTRGEDREEPGH